MDKENKRFSSTLMEPDMEYARCLIASRDAYRKLYEFTGGIMMDRARKDGIDTKELEEKINKAYKVSVEQIKKKIFRDAEVFAKSLNLNEDKMFYTHENHITSFIAQTVISEIGLTPLNWLLND